jgi:L-Ala-D/L-Glu epimerase
MKITAVEAIPYSIPYRQALAFAVGEVSAASHVLLRVHTDEGIVGHADMLPRPYTYGETTGSILAAVKELISPILTGQDPFSRSVTDDFLKNTVANNTVKAAVDLALWDILGKAAGLSCHQLLGGYTDHVVVSHMVGIDTPEAMEREALWVREEFGITTLKIKVGRRDFLQDVEAVKRIRAAVGPTASIGLDANHGWTADSARQAMDQLGDQGITLVEEPCPASELSGRRDFVQKSRIPVYADESIPTLDMVARELLSGACNGVNIKTSRSGFTQSSQILSTCQALGVDVLVGNQIDTQLGTLASVAFASAYEATTRRPAEVSNFLLIADDLLAEPIEVRQGRISVRESPGLGITIDEDKLSTYRTDK